MRSETLLSIWSRRAITLPLWSLLFCLWVATAPLWLGLGLAADALGGGERRLPRTRALCFFGLYLFCEVTGVLAAGSLWLVALGGRLGGAEAFLEANAALQRRFCGALFHGTVLLYGMQVEVEGRELAARAPYLLFVRHSSIADTVLAAALIANPTRILLKYVLKRELMWDPCLDIVGRRLPNAFVDRASSSRRGEIEAVAHLARGLDATSAVLIYPEGTRFRPEKLAASLEALRRDAPALAAIAEAYRSVLPPRLGGPLALLEAVPEVDVIFMEHTGFEGAATLARFWAGTLVGQTIRVRLRRVASSAIPPGDRDRWLFEQWAQTDAWVTARSRAGGAG